MYCCSSFLLQQRYRVPQRDRESVALLPPSPPPKKRAEGRYMHSCLLLTSGPTFTPTRRAPSAGLNHMIRGEREFRADDDEEEEGAKVQIYRSRLRRRPSKKPPSPLRTPPPPSPTKLSLPPFQAGRDRRSHRFRAERLPRCGTRSRTTPAPAQQEANADRRSAPPPREKRDFLHLSMPPAPRCYCCTRRRRL